MPANRVHDLFNRLYTAYGPQGWWPANGQFETIVGAILTQRTAWRNAEQALRNLTKLDLMSVEALHRVPIRRLAEAIRASGFYNMKARKLKEIVAYIVDCYGGEMDRFLSRPTDRLRDELLGVYGIGEETADAILVYAADRPSFVVDAYARRLLSRLGWIAGNEPYGVLRSLFLSNVPPDVDLLGEYHALIVRHSKAFCLATPRCARCPLRTICEAGQDTRDGKSRR